MSLFQVCGLLSRNCGLGTEITDIWFHRYENGRDIEGRCKLSLVHPYIEEELTVSVVDYNSWIESDTGRKLADSLDKDVVLAEGMCRAGSLQHEKMKLILT